MSGNGDGLDHLRIPYEKIKFGDAFEFGGYGTVSKGEFNGQDVALKKLNITNLANIMPTLLDEILTISRFGQHPNVVALLGFYNDKNNQMILVYEFVATMNLEKRMIRHLTTIERFEICLGAARGLCYLHTDVDSTTRGIVHGNIKLSKILLKSDASSSKYEAKVFGFGLSKTIPGKPHKTSSDDKLTKKSDVYSFGVLLLEVLCGVSELMDDGRKRHVSELVPKKMKQDKLRKILRHDIQKEIKTEALETYAAIACQCVMAKRDDRPNMAKVVEELEKALKLQGGKVTYVQIPGIRKEPVNENPSHMSKVDDAREVKGDEVNIVGVIPESCSFEKNITKATNMVWLKIAPYWRQALSLKKATEDWITKDGVIRISITATAIGLIASGFAATLIRRN